MRQVRCAIYTRKSSEEGLEQDFNSLDAQREACAAYVLSQASEGWTASAERYDDGGISGGTLERPALQRLLADIAAGKVDIVVVYKVDRLSRSLFDFAKLVERFDAAKTSFVSVTQSFNTTTSMGRLTLNMLLSFAQFEREVTAERIRDKIAASKAKGMWMGGTPPLGYQPSGRSLAIVEEHAELVRHIFQRYLVLRNVRLLAEELAREQVTLPVRQRLNGSGSFGGGAFSRGQIYKLLANPIYVGRIAHGGTSYTGLHPPIIDQQTFDNVQALLAANTQGSRQRVRAAQPSLLAGKVYDESDEPLIGTHATKVDALGRTVRYRYYVSQALHEKRSDLGMRIPAREIEGVVAARLAALFSDPHALIADCQLAVAAGDYALVIARAKELAARCQQRDRPLIDKTMESVTVEREQVVITCVSSAIASLLNVPQMADAPATIIISTAVRLTRTGRAMRLVEGSGSAVASHADPAVVRLLVKARRWWAVLREEEVDVSGLAARERVSASYLTRVLRLAFLAPGVVEAMLAGRLRSGVDAAALTATDALPASWAAQGVAFLPANSG